MQVAPATTTELTTKNSNSSNAVGEETSSIQSLPSLTPPRMALHIALLILLTSLCVTLLISNTLITATLPISTPFSTTSNILHLGIFNLCMGGSPTLDCRPLTEICDPATAPVLPLPQMFTDAVCGASERLAMQVSAVIAGVACVAVLVVVGHAVVGFVGINMRREKDWWLGRRIVAVACGLVGGSAVCLVITMAVAVATRGRIVDMSDGIITASIGIGAWMGLLGVMVSGVFVGLQTALVVSGRRTVPAPGIVVTA